MALINSPPAPVPSDTFSLITASNPERAPPVEVIFPLALKLPETVAPLVVTLNRSASVDPSYVLKINSLGEPLIPSKLIFAPSEPELPLKRSVGTFALSVLLSVKWGVAPSMCVSSKMDTPPVVVSNFFTLL